MSEIQELSKWMTREKKDRAVEAMLPKIMATATKSSRGNISLIMVEMMPKCLETALPKLSKDDRVRFALEIVSILVEKGSVRMTEKESEEYRSLLVKRIST